MPAAGVTPCRSGRLSAVPERLLKPDQLRLTIRKRLPASCSHIRPELPILLGAVLVVSFSHECFNILRRGVDTLPCSLNSTMETAKRAGGILALPWFAAHRITCLLFHVSGFLLTVLGCTEIYGRGSAGGITQDGSVETHGATVCGHFEGVAPFRVKIPPSFIHVRVRLFLEVCEVLGEFGRHDRADHSLAIREVD